MTEWTNLVSKVYKDNHAKDSNYKFKDALKDASKMYKKSSASGKTMKMRKSHKKRGRRGKSRRRSQSQSQSESQE
jgi:hypothetical protein